MALAFVVVIGLLVTMALLRQLVSVEDEASQKAGWFSSMRTSDDEGEGETTSHRLEALPYPFVQAQLDGFHEEELNLVPREKPRLMGVLPQETQDRPFRRSSVKPKGSLSPVKLVLVPPAERLSSISASLPSPLTTTVVQPPFQHINWTASFSAQPVHRILVVITHCCGNQGLTRRLLSTLEGLKEEFDVVVLNDAASDDSAEHLRAQGIMVIDSNNADPKQPLGLSKTWNVAWRFFLQHLRYKTLFLCNNDILVSAGTFARLHTALHAWNDSTRPIVMGPSTTMAGLGAASGAFLAAQNVEKREYSQQPAFIQLLQGLPSTLTEANRFLRRQYNSSDSAPPMLSRTASLLGFLVGIKRDHRLEAEPGCIVLPGLWNTGQEEDLFRRAQAVVAQDVLVYHDKAATFSSMSPERNRFSKQLTPTNQCRDTYPDYKCREMQEHGFCRSTTSSVWTECRKTCGSEAFSNCVCQNALFLSYGFFIGTVGLCHFNMTSKNECTDQLVECPRLASQGKCDKDFAFMSLQCRQSCAFCPSLEGK